MFWNGKAGDHKKESATKIPGCYGSPDPENMQHRANKGKRVGATVGTFAATLFGSMAAIYGLEVGEDSKKLYGSFAASVAIATAAAIVVNLSLASKEITLIEILPDSPSERRPKPTNKKERSNTTALGEAPPPHSLRNQVRSGFAGKPGERSCGKVSLLICQVCPCMARRQVLIEVPPSCQSNHFR